MLPYVQALSINCTVNSSFSSLLNWKNTCPPWPMALKTPVCRGLIRERRWAWDKEHKISRSSSDPTISSERDTNAQVDSGREEVISEMMNETQRETTKMSKKCIYIREWSRTHEGDAWHKLPSHSSRIQNLPIQQMPVLFYSTISGYFHT